MADNVDAFRSRWSIAPYFIVDDVVATANYYRDKLGFAYERFWNEPPSFCMVRRSGVVIMLAQLEQPGNLDRWDNPAYRLTTLILMRCGLRISDALKLPSACVVTDRDGAPYLRYSNHKMKREALVPIDDELHAEISSQQQRVLQRWPDGAPDVVMRVVWQDARAGQPPADRPMIHRRAGS